MFLSDPISTIVPSLERQIFRVLAHASGGLTGSRIADLVGRGSNAGTRHALARLERTGLLQTRRVGSAVVYRPETNHLLWPAVEALVEAADGFMERLQGAIESLVVTSLGPGPQPSIGFFGSVARREYSSDSDLDIVLVVSDEQEERLPAVVEELTDAAVQWTGNDCAVAEMTRTRLREMVDARDPFVASLVADTRTFTGPDVREMIWRGRMARVTLMTPVDCRERADAGRAHLAVAEQARERAVGRGRSADAQVAASNAVSAAIAASDAVCGAALGERSSEQDHEQAGPLMSAAWTSRVRHQ